MHGLSFVAVVSLVPNFSVPLVPKSDWGMNRPRPICPKAVASRKHPSLYKRVNHRGSDPSTHQHQHHLSPRPSSTDKSTKSVGSEQKMHVSCFLSPLIEEGYRCRNKSSAIHQYLSSGCAIGLGCRTYHLCAYLVWCGNGVGLSGSPVQTMQNSGWFWCVLTSSTEIDVDDSLDPQTRSINPQPTTSHFISFQEDADRRSSRGRSFPAPSIGPPR